MKSIILGIEIDSALIAYLLQQNGIETVMITNQLEYSRQRPIALHCDSKWIQFLIHHSMHQSIELLQSNGLKINDYHIPINKQQVFNSEFSLKDKRYVMRFVEAYLQANEVLPELPSYLQPIAVAIKDPLLHFNKESLTKAGNYKSQSPQIISEYNLEQELCQLLSRRAALLGGLQVMNAKITTIKYSDKFIVQTQYGTFESDILIIQSQSIYLIRQFNPIITPTTEIWYFSEKECNDVHSIEMNTELQSYSILHNAIKYTASKIPSPNAQSLVLQEYQCDFPNIFIIPQLVSILGLNDDILAMGHALVDKIVNKYL